MVTWAMRNGKVPSSSIDVQERALAIPQLIQGHLGQAVRRHHGGGGEPAGRLYARPVGKRAGDGAARRGRQAKARPGVPRDGTLKTPQDLEG